MENVQDGRYDELQVKKVLREDVGERNGGLSDPSQANREGGLSLEKVQDGQN